MRLHPYVKWALVGLLAALLLGAALVAWWARPDSLREELAGRLGERLGRPVTIGALRYRWWPLGELELRDVAVAGTGQGSPPILRLGRARVMLGTPTIDLVGGSPREVRVTDLELDGLALDLAIDAEGRGNWEELLAALQGPAAPTPARDGGPGMAIAIDRLAAHDLDLRLVDARDGSDRRLKQGSLEATALNPATGVGSLSAAGLLERKDQPPLPLRVEVKQATWDTARSAFAVARGDVAAGPLKVAADGVSGSWAAPLRVEAHVVVAPFAPRPALALFGLPLPPTTDREALAELAVDTRLLVAGTGLRLDELVVGLDGTRLKGNVVRSTEGGSAAWGFRLQADRLDLDRYLPPEQPDDAAFDIPWSTARETRAQGTLVVGELRLAGITFRDASLLLRTGARGLEAARQ